MQENKRGAVARIALRSHRSVLTVVLLAALVFDAIWARQNFPAGTRDFWMFGSPVAWVVWLLFVFSITNRDDRRFQTIILFMVGVPIYFLLLFSPCGGLYGIWGLSMLPAAVLVSTPLLAAAVLASFMFSFIASLPRRLRIPRIPLWVPWAVAIASCGVMLAGAILAGAYWHSGTPCAL